jgi:hypothetical protein
MDPAGGTLRFAGGQLATVEEKVKEGQYFPPTFNV